MIRLTPEQLRNQVPSPCVSLCKMNQDTGMCEGCWRTLDEIIAWGTASDPAKREIWQKIALRKSEPQRHS